MSPRAAPDGPKPRPAPAPPAAAGRGSRVPRRERQPEAHALAATAPSGPPAVPGVAFFDFDHTLIHGDAGPLFGAYLFRWRKRQLGGGGFWTRMGGRILWVRYLPFLAWMALKSVFHVLRMAKRSGIVRTAYRGLKGVKVDQFNALLDGFVERELPDRVYQEMVEVIRWHQSLGRRCVIVTTGMERLIERALAMHFPPGVELIGCRLLERNGRLTGRVLGPLFGVDKANIVHAYCRAIRVDPARCWAYSDHFSDKEMLQAVGNPVAVNPRTRLRRLCLRNGWTILRPRAAR